MKVQEIIKRIKSADLEGDWQEVVALWRLTETLFGVSNDTIKVHQAIGKRGLKKIIELHTGMTAHESVAISHRSDALVEEFSGMAKDYRAILPTSPAKREALQDAFWDSYDSDGE